MVSARFDKIAVPTILALSIAVPLVVLILMYLPERYTIFETESGTFPMFHAILNGATAILLILGYFFISIKDYRMHRQLMFAAFGVSCLGSIVIDAIPKSSSPLNSS